MIGITHFAVGAAGGAIINERLDRDKLLVPVVSGIFAMAPDGNKILHTVFLDSLHNSILANVFWLHGTLDALETGYPEVEGSIALVLLLFVAIVTRSSRPQTTS